MPKSHLERHYVTRIGWLRAAVLGANDGILSTASLMVGVAAGSTGSGPVLIAGLAGLVAGAMSMAAGEYVSVSSQSDAEAADLVRERAELRADPAGELEELTRIYLDRGLEPTLARQVATALTDADALTAHARDELGISDLTAARPVQAALASAGSFAVGAALPLLAGVLAPAAWLGASVTVVSLTALIVLGAIGAKAGGASVRRGVVRVTFWGAFAMALTSAIGALSGAVL